MVEKIPIGAWQFSRELNHATCFCLFLIALESEIANSLLMRREVKSKMPQEMTELQTGVYTYSVLNTEDFRGLFLKTLRSFEKSLMNVMACETCSTRSGRVASFPSSCPTPSRMALIPDEQGAALVQLCVSGRDSSASLTPSFLYFKWAGMVLM